MFSTGGTRRTLSVSGHPLIRQNIPLSLVVRRAVCRRCNNEWMSELQNQAKPILKRMILGERINIAWQAQRVIAAWATMTSMVLDFSKPVMPGPIYAQDERTEFYRDHRMPDGTNVWMAHRRFLPDLAVAGWQIHGCWVTTDPTEERTLGNRNNVYASTGIFAHLVLQLLSQRTGTEIPDLSRLSVIHHDWRTKHLHLPIFPPEVSIAWPPPLPLKESEIKPFAERWARLGPRRDPSHDDGPPP